CVELLSCPPGHTDIVDLYALALYGFVTVADLQVFGDEVLRRRLSRCDEHGRLLGHLRLHFEFPLKGLQICIPLSGICRKGQTSSMRAIGALSPWRGPSFRIRV